MAEHALSYFIALVVVCNVSVMLALVGIVVFLPRMTRRRPAHRAEAAPLRARLTLVAGRPAAPRGSRVATARAA
ncbi:hypothetical protein ACFFGH_22735 [Lysobacter korlensis]|uniref:Uncharacterized protein n=1 Tax=Lysobacter korlensis TaxID=553636 RepID=A0ABV6RUL3_9GAMM